MLSVRYFGVAFKNGLVFGLDIMDSLAYEEAEDSLLSHVWTDVLIP